MRMTLRRLAMCFIVVSNIAFIPMDAVNHDGWGALVSFLLAIFFLWNLIDDCARSCK